MIESTLTPALEAWQTADGRNAWRRIGDLLRSGIPAERIAQGLGGSDLARYRVTMYAAIVLRDDPAPPAGFDPHHVGLRLALVAAGYLNPADEQERRQAVGILRRRLEAVRSLRPLAVTV